MSKYVCGVFAQQIAVSHFAWMCSNWCSLYIWRLNEYVKCMHLKCISENSWHTSTAWHQYSMASACIILSAKISKNKMNFWNNKLFQITTEPFQAIQKVTSGKVYPSTLIYFQMKRHFAFVCRKKGPFVVWNRCLKKYEMLATTNCLYILFVCLSVTLFSHICDSHTFISSLSLSLSRPFTILFLFFYDLCLNAE